MASGLERVKNIKNQIFSILKTYQTALQTTERATGGIFSLGNADEKT